MLLVQGPYIERRGPMKLLELYFDRSLVICHVTSFLCLGKWELINIISVLEQSSTQSRPFHYPVTFHTLLKQKEWNFEMFCKQF